MGSLRYCECEWECPVDKVSSPGWRKGRVQVGVAQMGCKMEEIAGLSLVFPVCIGTVFIGVGDEV